MSSNRKEIQPPENKTQTGQPFETYPRAVDRIILSYLDTPDLDKYLISGLQSVQLQFFVKTPSRKIKPSTEAVLKANLIDCVEQLLEHKVIADLPEKKDEAWTKGSYADLYNALEYKIVMYVEKLCSYDEKEIKKIEKPMSDVVFHFCRNRPNAAGACLHRTLEKKKPLIVLYLIRYGANLIVGGKEISYSTPTPTLYPLQPHRFLAGDRAYYSSLFLALSFNYPTECVESMLDHGAPLALYYVNDKARVDHTEAKPALLFIAAMNCPEKTVQLILRRVNDDTVTYVHETLNSYIKGESWCQPFHIEADKVSRNSVLKAKLKLMDAKESLTKKEFPFTDADVKTLLQATHSSLTGFKSVDECLLRYDELHQSTDAVLHPLIWGDSKYADPSAAKEFKEPENAPHTYFRIHVIYALQRAILTLNIAHNAKSVDELLNSYDKVMAHPLYDREHTRTTNTVHAETTMQWQSATLDFLMKLLEIDDSIDSLTQYHEICLRVLKHALFSKDQQGVDVRYRTLLENRIKEIEDVAPECRVTAMGLTL